MKLSSFESNENIKSVSFFNVFKFFFLFFFVCFFLNKNIAFYSRPESRFPMLPQVDLRLRCEILPCFLTVINQYQLIRNIKQCKTKYHLYDEKRNCDSSKL